MWPLLVSCPNYEGHLAPTNDFNCIILDIIVNAYLLNLLIQSL